MRLGTGSLLWASCGSAIASVCAVGLLAIERLAGGVYAALAVLCGGLLSLALSRRFSKMAAVVPSTAGILAYLSRGLGRRRGLLLSLPYLLFSLFLVGAEATVVGLLLARVAFLPPLLGSLLFLCGTFLLCRTGRRLSLRAEAIATLALLVSLSVLALVSVGAAAASGQLGARLLLPAPSLGRFVAAVGQALFLFMGFELITCQADLATPVSLRRSLAGSVVVLSVFYATLALGLACLKSLPGSFLPQLEMAESAGGRLAALGVALLSLLASYTSFNGGLLSLSRLTAALSAQGSLPRGLGRVDGRTLMPQRALWALLFFCGVATGLVRFLGLLRPAILAAAAAAALAYAAVAWSRERTPFREAGRGLLRRLLGRGLSGLLFLVALGVIVDASAAPQFGTLLLLLGLGGLLTLGIVLYPVLFPRNRRRQPCPST